MKTFVSTVVLTLAVILPASANLQSNYTVPPKIDHVEVMYERSINYDLFHDCNEWLVDELSLVIDDMNKQIRQQNLSLIKTFVSNNSNPHRNVVTQRE